MSDAEKKETTPPPPPNVNITESEKPKLPQNETSTRSEN